MHIEVSEGEAIDKLTILEIKRALLADPVQRANVERDLQQLGNIVASAGLLDDPVIVTGVTTPSLRSVVSARRSRVHVGESRDLEETSGELAGEREDSQGVQRGSWVVGGDAAVVVVASAA